MDLRFKGCYSSSGGQHSQSLSCYSPNSLFSTPQSTMDAIHQELGSPWLVYLLLPQCLLFVQLPSEINMVALAPQLPSNTSLFQGRKDAPASSLTLFSMTPWSQMVQPLPPPILLTRAESTQLARPHPLRRCSMTLVPFNLPHID